MHSWMIHFVRNCGVRLGATRAHPREGRAGGPTGHGPRSKGRQLKRRERPHERQAKSGQPREVVRLEWEQRDRRGGTFGHGGTSQGPLTAPTVPRPLPYGSAPSPSCSIPPVTYSLIYLSWPNPRDMANIQIHSVTWTASSQGQQRRFFSPLVRHSRRRPSPSWQHVLLSWQPPPPHCFLPPPVLLVTPPPVAAPSPSPFRGGPRPPLHCPALLSMAGRPGDGERELKWMSGQKRL